MGVEEKRWIGGWKILEDEVPLGVYIFWGD